MLSLKTTVDASGAETSSTMSYWLRAGAELAVHWTMDEDGLKLEWRETGVAAVNATPQHRGFGREWIEQGLAYQLGALTSLEFLPGGVLCTIRVPREHILEGRT